VNGHPAICLVGGQTSKGSATDARAESVASLPAIRESLSGAPRWRLPLDSGPFSSTEQPPEVGVRIRLPHERPIGTNMPTALRPHGRITGSRGWQDTNQPRRNS
jgi:hypothetical protein